MGWSHHWELGYHRGIGHLESVRDRGGDLAVGQIDVHTLGRRDRVVLAALSVSRPGAATPDQLAEVLWPSGPPASAAKVVHGCISRLRNRLGSDAIATAANGYLLSPAS